MIYGFLRETKEQAIKAGIDKSTRLHRTGLEEYLKVIFPETTDWVHDKVFGIHNNINYRIRPDYRSDSLKLIVEFDGLPHYQDPSVILKDEKNTQVYESCGYKVVRIPYFIQLSVSAIKILFGVDVEEEFFDESIPSLSSEGKNTPAFLCPMGIERMKEDFKKFPTQYKVNKEYLESLNNEQLTVVLSVSCFSNSFSILSKL